MPKLPYQVLQQIYKILFINENTTYNKILTHVVMVIIL